jgi:hypothetical protein
MFLRPISSVSQTSGAPLVWVPGIIGLTVLLQALMTGYELGLMKVIPIGIHLMADYLVGAFLVALALAVRLQRLFSNCHGNRRNRGSAGAWLHADDTTTRTPARCHGVAVKDSEDPCH